MTMPTPHAGPDDQDRVDHFHLGDHVRNRHTDHELTVTAEGTWLARFYELVTCVHDTAVVHIVARHGRIAHRRVLWRVSVTDAKRICSDPRTSGRNYMLVWTTTNIDDPSINRYVPDNGTHAAVLAELGVTVLGSHETNRAPTTQDTTTQDTTTH